MRSQEEANERFLLGIVRHLNMPVKGEPWFTYSFLCDPPPFQTGLRLVDYETFLEGNHRAAPLIIGRDGAQIKEALNGALENLKPPPSLVGINVSTPADSSLIYPGNVRIWEWGQFGNAATSLTSVTFFFSYPKGPAPNIPAIPVTFRMGTIETGPLALEWLRSSAVGKELLDKKSGALFPNLKLFWGRVGLMNVDGATVFLEDQIESTRRGSLSFFGITVERSLVIWVGPALCLSLLLFLVLHLRHLLQTSRGDPAVLGEAVTYPWVICFSDTLSSVVSYSTLFVLPLIANLFLLLRHGDWQESTTRLGWAVLGGFVICSSFGVFLVHQFRSQVGLASAGARTLKAMQP